MASRKRSPRIIGSRRQRRCLPPLMEGLENRLLLSEVIVPIPKPVKGQPIDIPAADLPKVSPILVGKPVASPLGTGTDQSAGPVGYIPQQLQDAYGVNLITFGSGPTAEAGNGLGQTIAIIDWGDNTSFEPTTSANYRGSALQVFDQTFGLADPPSFQIYRQDGTVGRTGTNLGTGDEIALDIEWAHAIAPGANIALIEADSNSFADLGEAEISAATVLHASVVSMSFSASLEGGGFGYYEPILDNLYFAPALAADPNITYLASTGDDGSDPGAGYPAVSPLVGGVGGTSLTINGTGPYTYGGETAWSGGGGGVSNTYAEPSYQLNNGFTYPPGLSGRTIPDISSDADPDTGVAIYDPQDFGAATPWEQVGGTSLSSPTWAGFIAIADQGRQFLYNEAPLGGPSQTLPALYTLQNVPNSYNIYFHDITIGNNGLYSAKTGYDLTSGIGTPRANNLLPTLAAYGTASKAVITYQPPNDVIQGGFFGTALEAQTSNGSLATGFSGTATISLTSGPGTLSGTTTVNFDDGVAFFNNLNLSTVSATPYTFKIVVQSGADTLSTLVPDSVVVNQAASTHGVYYPLPLDASIRDDVSTIDSDNNAIDDVYLVYSQTYELYSGQLLLQNDSSLATKTVNWISADQFAATAPVINANQDSRVFEIIGASGGTTNLSVNFQGQDSSDPLVIEGGLGTDDGGLLIPTGTAVGGGLLVDGGNVVLSNVKLSGNEAKGGTGSRGSTGASRTGGPGGPGKRGYAGQGGAIYIAAGTLTLDNDSIVGNVAQGGNGGVGGTGGLAGTISVVGSFEFIFLRELPGGPGGTGGVGGTGQGGAIYLAGGSVSVTGGSMVSNSALGGAGGKGGFGGHGGTVEQHGGTGGLGGIGGQGQGGGIYLDRGSLTLNSAAVNSNSAAGGAGGKGGTGGEGGYSISDSRVFGPGGDAGIGGLGGNGSGGGMYVLSGTISWFDSSVDNNNAVAGAGGAAGVIGHGAAGGVAGTAGQSGSGVGGGIFDQGNLTLTGASVIGNSADDGAGIDIHGTLTLNSSDIEQNVATDDGGGINITGVIYVNQSTLADNEATLGGAIDSSGTFTLTGGLLSGDTASQSGGGIYSSGKGTISGTEFLDNSASLGGGIYSFTNSILIVSNAQFYENNAARGGGIYNLASLQVSASVFGSTLPGEGGNVATGFGGVGGAIFNQKGIVTVSDSSFTGNSAANGGAVDSVSGTLSLTGGSFTSNSATGFGGAIDTSGTTTITGVTLSSNSVPGGTGGAIYDQGTLTVTSSTIGGTSAGEGNSARVGGGIANDGTLSLTGTVLTDNAATGGTAGVGGGLYVSGGAVAVSGGSFTGNTATGGGGGIYVNKGTLTIVANTALTLNSALEGGALDNVGGTASLTNVTLSDNSAQTLGLGGAIINFDILKVTIASFLDNTAIDGGGLFNYGTATISDVTLSGDSATTDGGGIYNNGALDLTNSTVADESAAFGGGVFNSLGTLTALNVTIAENSVTAGGSGGGLNVAGGVVILYNTIVSANTSGASGPASDIAGTVSALSVYNLIGSGGSGGLVDGVNHNQVGEAPELGPLGPNGGPTDTIALLVGSPAIDHGGNAIAGVTVPTSDQRGALRGNDGGLNAGTVVDIGAYEASSSYLVTTTTDSLAYGTLRSAVGWANLSVNDNPANISDPAPNTVVFDTTNVFATAQTLTLTQGTLVFSDTTTPEAIAGDGVSNLTISGGGTSQPIQVLENVTVGLSDFTISGGNATSFGAGGAIASDGALTLTGMLITNNTAPDGGGGVLNQADGTLTVNSSTLSNNVASAGLGGGIYSLGALVVKNSVFTGNSASEAGGGIDSAGSLQVTGSTFSGNSASAGGAIDISGSTADNITGSTLSGNSAADGAGIYNSDLAPVALDDSTLSNNAATGSGGGIFNQVSTMTITDSTLSGNTAVIGGGGVFNASGTLTVTASTFTGNSASLTGSGGAIWSDGTVGLTNVTIAGNSALYGGGIDNSDSGTLTALNVTIAYNTVASGGAGGGLNGDSGTANDLFNTVVALNTIGSGSLVSASDIAGPAAPSSSNNLIGTGGSGGLMGGTNGNLVGVTKPGLASGLANNGGPTQTIALVTGSPAIDGGAYSFTGGLTAPTVDQRGALRGTAGLNAGLYPDIGAYEASSSYLVSTLNDSTDVGTLRSAIGWANISTNANKEQLTNPQPNTIVFGVMGTVTLSQGAIALTNTKIAEVIDGGGTTVSGGGISGVFTVASGVTASITDISIIDGNAAANGGGIDNSGTLTLTDVVIGGNRALDGGGITNEANATLSITDSTLTVNTATKSGGGLDNMGVATILHSTIGNNTAGTGGGIANLLSGVLISSGGGIVPAPANLTITDTTIEGNSATSGNGGGIDNTGTVTIGQSTINNNTAKALGGAIGNETGGIFTATNVTLADNSAASGAGIGNSGTATFVNATIAYNTATTLGGGVYVAAGTTSLYNTIVAANYLGTAATESDIAVAAGSGKVGPTSSYNLIGSGGAGGLSGNGNKILAKGASPGLAASLANNGGPTETLALLASSPAIDGGNASIPGANVPLIDQRGALRGPAGLDAGSSPDIGAFEATSSYLVTTTSVRPDVGTIETAVAWANISTNVNPANPVADPAPNTIVFDASSTGIFSSPQTIVLSAGPLVFTDATSIPKAISGAGTTGLALSGGNQVGVLEVAAGVTADVSGLTITGGSATDGGAIDNFGNLSIDDATFSGNAATSGGAVDNEAGATLSVLNSTFSTNTATTGGAIFNTATGTATITDSTIAGNTATTGGGIANAGTLTTVSATIADNLATMSGGGGGLDNTGAGVATLYDTIVALNNSGTAPSANDIAGSVAAASTYNLVDNAGSAGGLTGPTNIVGVSAGLSTAGLANNGGPTETIALAAGSAAINTGAASITGVTVPAFDQRGTLRNPDDLNDGTTIDIGAFEASSTYLVTTPADTLGSGTLRSAVAWANATPSSSLSGPITILFDPKLFNSTTPQTITLSAALGTLDLTNLEAPILIQGPGAGGLTISGGGAIEIFSVAPGVTLTLTGATIADGFAAQQSPSAGSGGAILNQGTLTIGGATPVSADVFSGNEATYYGGAIYNDGGTLTISDTTFTGNISPYGLGGAIDNAGTATITNSTFTGGTAYQGGAIDNKSGTLSIAYSSLVNNSGTLGGAIFNNASATISDSTIADDNTSFDGGGIANDLGGTMTIVNSTIAFNHSGQTGGGINQVGGGNGQSGSLTVINSTIAYNSIDAGGAGGGIDASSGTTNLYNTIVALNTAGAGKAATASDISGTVSLVSAYNLIGTGGAGGLTSGTSGNQVAVANPGLATALASNGGPTQTIALLAGSPAIDAGSNALAVDANGNPLLFDQRGIGYPRIVNAIVDIGAYERALATTTTLKSSLNPSLLGQAVTFTATVAPVKASTTIPAGTVTFYIGTSVAATVTLVSGVATYTTSALPLGSSTVTAVYSGNLTYADSTSAVLTQTVTKTATLPIASSGPLTGGSTGSAALAPIASDLSGHAGKKAGAVKKPLIHGGSTTKFHQSKHTASLKRSVAVIAKHASAKTSKKK